MPDVSVFIDFRWECRVGHSVGPEELLVLVVKVDSIDEFSRSKSFRLFCLRIWIQPDLKFFHQCKSFSLRKKYCFQNEKNIHFRILDTRMLETYLKNLTCKAPRVSLRRVASSRLPSKYSSPASSDYPCQAREPSESWNFNLSFIWTIFENYRCFVRSFMTYKNEMPLPPTWSILRDTSTWSLVGGLSIAEIKNI